MPIPVMVPAPAPILTVPYLTNDAFAAYPHWLDLDNLVPGGVQAMQDSELSDALLAASDACITLDEGRLMRLDAHYVQAETHELLVGSDGRVNVRFRDVPARGLVAVQYGADPGDMRVDTLPNPTGWLTATGRQYGFRPGGRDARFPTPPRWAQSARRNRAFISLWYLAGFPSTTLAAACTDGDSGLDVADPTGILPGDPLAFYDAGQSETVTVAGTYVPQVPTVPPAAATVPLASPARFSHGEGVLTTGMPRAVLQAVICFAIAFLLREDVTEEAPVDPFGSGRRTTAFGRGGQAGGLINDALGFLEPYRPGWRP